LSAQAATTTPVAATIAGSSARFGLLLIVRMWLSDNLNAGA
jgi:hypothetical protein